MKTKIVSHAAWSWIVVGFVACATDVHDIDRTQANRIDKQIFTGEWYFRPAVVETEYHNGLLFEGLEGDLDLVKWEIREHQLIAYRSYELLIGAETGTGDTEFKGNPVAMFAITSHFDVIREYNPATGEQNNVLIENTTDRPWWQRRYMRVDWSQNLLNNPFTLEGFANIVGSSPYYIQENEHDNPHRAEVSAQAINIVNVYHLSTDFETCYYTFMDLLSCGGATAKIKLSFLKTETRDYEPLYYPDTEYVPDAQTGKPVVDCDDSRDPSSCQKVGIPMFQRFGFFRSERRAYNDEYQWTRDGRIFLANRWNIWKRTYDRAGTLIPIAKRQPGEVRYVTNVGFPTETSGAYDADIWSAATALVNEWDGALRETVLQLKRQDDPNVSQSDVPSVFNISQNRCTVANATAYASKSKLQTKLANYGIQSIQKSNLARACAVLEWASGREFTWEKTGDLRYSFLHWVDAPQASGPLGYGPSSADPRTGEIVSANAYLYGAAIDTLAAYAADVISLMNDPNQLDNIFSGANIRDYIKRQRGADAAGGYNTMKAAALAQRLAPLKATFSDTHVIPKGGRGLGASLQTQRTRLGEGASRQVRDYAQLAANSKMSRIIGTDLERELLANDDLKRALLGPAKFQPGQNSAVEFSPISLTTDELLKKHEEVERLLGARAIDTMDFSDDGLLSLASELAAMSWQEVYAYLRRETFRAVATHEVGHTLGLRHNFAGSFDALNFHPSFWSFYSYDSNTGTGKINRTDAGGNPTLAERLMYSSIMDYSARFYGDDFSGIGPYDTAAIKFGYGQLVEVFGDDLSPFIAPPSFDTLTFLYDYTDLPKLLSGEVICTSRNNCHPDYLAAIDHDSASRNASDPSTAVLESALSDRSFVSYLQNVVDDVTPRPQNIWRRHDVSMDAIRQQWRAYYNGGGGLPDEVPYRFCPDELTFPTNIPCQRYDKGANYREVIADRMERYDAYYVFSNFRRDRFEFNDQNYVNTYLARILNRYFGPMSNTYQDYLFSFVSIGRNSTDDVVSLADFPVGKDWGAAAFDGLNNLAAVYQQPEPGDYCLDTLSNVYVLTADSSTCAPANSLNVPLGVGKYYNTRWTDEYFYKATTLGSFFDKWAALFALTNNQGFFYQNFSDLLDSGAFSLSYWRGFQPEMLDLFRSGFVGGASRFAWRYDSAASLDKQFVTVPVVDQYTNSVNETLPKIQSGDSWTLRYLSILLPMGRFNSMFDVTDDFSNFARVCLQGAQDCYDLSSSGGPGFVTYADPLSLYTYVAADVADPQKAVGKAMLQDAQDFVDTSYVPAKNLYDAAVVDPNNFVLTSEESTAGYTRPQALVARGIALRAAERGIHERTSFIDVVRRIGLAMEYGG